MPQPPRVEFVYECPNCDGAFTIDWIHPWSKEEYDTSRVPCPYCEWAILEEDLREIGSYSLFLSEEQKQNDPIASIEKRSTAYRVKSNPIEPAVPVPTYNRERTYETAPAEDASSETGCGMEKKSQAGAKAMSNYQVSDCSALIDACALNLYEKNIFRITGLPVDATAKEVARQAQKLQMMEEMGGALTPAAFPLNPPPSTEQIREALARMKEPEHRLVDEFFWYWPETFGESRSDPAILALLAGEGQKAVDIWVERENEGSVTATHNLAVMFHMFAVDWTNHHVKNQLVLSHQGTQDSPWAPPKSRGAILENGRDEKIKGYWKDAFDRWEQLADSDDLWDVVKGRVRSLEDEALTTGFVRRMRNVLPQAFDKINAEAALKFAELEQVDWATFHVDFMRQTHQGLDDVTSTAELVLAPTKKRVEQRLSSAQNDSTTHPENGTQIAMELIGHCKPLMALFDMFHGSESHQRAELFDEVAKTVADVLIAYQCATGDDKTFVEILQHGLEFATGSQIRERMINNIAIGQGNLAAKQLEPFFNSMKLITEGNIVPSEKVQQIRDKILPQLPALATQFGSTSPVYHEVMDSVAIALRSIAIDSHNSRSDFDTAEQAIQMASKLACSADLKKRIASNATEMTLSRCAYELAQIGRTKKPRFSPEFRQLLGLLSALFIVLPCAGILGALGETIIGDIGAGLGAIIGLILGFYILEKLFNRIDP
jgi:hypothetical protein